MQSSKRIVAGVDEVGRGPLAGPVMACAVVFLPNLDLVKVSLTKSRKQQFKDSKQLSFKQREEYYQRFLVNPRIQWGIGRVSAKVIDRINIYEATKLAMQRAVKNLEHELKRKLKNSQPKYYSDRFIIHSLIIDGNTKINTVIPQKTVIRGDEKIALCAVASIIAKVTRDRAMIRYHKQYPQYGFDKHKGYGTRHHMKMLKKFGLCKIHRKSFAPVSRI